jgi:hypothetical protein
MLIGLLDLAYKEPVDWWLVFRNSEHYRPVLERWLKPGFRHVELWRPTDGVWLRVDPCLEFIEVSAHDQAPWVCMPVEWNSTFLRVRQIVSHGKVRKSFFAGPLTCVELTAAVMGIKTPFWCRTPYQLYKHLWRTNSVVQKTESA